MLVDSPRQLASLGDLDPVRAAPLTDAAVTPYRAIRRSQRVLTPGSVVTVIGVGGLGHLAVQILRAVSPATVVAVDPRPEARGLATSLGAHHVVEPGPDAADAIRDLTKGLGVDLCLDLVGSEQTLGLALRHGPRRLADHARRGGRRRHPLHACGRPGSRSSWPRRCGAASPTSAT